MKITNISDSILTDKDKNSLQEDLHEVSAWSVIWEMPFNTGRCQVPQVRTRNEKFTYKMCGVKLKKHPINQGPLYYCMHSYFCCLYTEKLYQLYTTGLISKYVMTTTPLVSSIISSKYYFCLFPHFFVSSCKDIITSLPLTSILSFHLMFYCFLKQSFLSC